MQEKNYYQNYITCVFGFFFLLFIYLIYSLSVSAPENSQQINDNILKTPARLRYEKVDFTVLPGFDSDNFAEAYPALKKSCEKILSSPREREVKKIYWDQSCKALLSLKLITDSTVRSVIKKYFAPYLVYDEKGQTEGIFTGYYSASLKGSYRKTSVYKYPVYKMPSDALLLNISDFTKCSECLYMVRMDGKKIVPYYTTAEINSGKINKSDVLFWADNPVDVMILHIQGSGVVMLPDGKEMKINYAGNNGHGFVGIGWLMQSLALTEKGKSSMQDIKSWLEANPLEAEKLISRNPRYIFFKKAEDNKGPIGSLGVELTPGRSIAVDNRFIQLGSFVWLATSKPSGEKLERLVTAQDTGAAIKGEIRADFYYGYGKKAFSDAGRMKQKGSYYLLIPKETVL